MNLEETATLITWLNQHDARVQLTNASRDIWHHSVSSFPFDVGRQAILEHYKDNEQFPATPATIKKRASQIMSRREAGQRAIDAAPRPVKHPMSWRARNPELWDQLFEEGRRQGNEERRRATEARQGRQEETRADWMAA